MNWYNIVSRNLDKIPECTAHFDKELLEAKKQCKILNKTEKDKKIIIIMLAFKTRNQYNYLLNFYNLLHTVFTEKLNVFYKQLSCLGFSINGFHN